MVPQSLESAVRDFDIFLGVGINFSGGPCAKDINLERKDYVSCVFPAPEILVVERRIIDADGKSHVLGPGNDIQLSYHVKNGYDFQI